MFLKTGGGKFLKNSAATGGMIQKNDTLGMSAAELARQIEVPTNRTTEILNGQLDRRHRIALGAFLWHQPGILAEPREPL